VVAGHVGVVRAQGGFANAEGTLVQRQGLPCPAKVRQRPAHVIEVDGYGRVVGGRDLIALHD
jgi:hypothetical protein